MVRVSYVLATLNRAGFLEKTLANIREFITDQDELLIIDGGSKDGTKEVIEANRDIVSCFVSEPDFGEAHALSKGIFRAKGAYIKLLTDDDHLFPEAVRKAVQTLEIHPKIDVLVCGGEHWRYESSNAGHPTFLCHSWLPPTESIKTCSYRIIESFGYVACGVGYWFHSRVIPQVGLLDSYSYIPDADYMAKFIEHGLIIKFLSVKLYRRTIYPHSGVNRGKEHHMNKLKLYIDHRRWDLATDGHYSEAAILEDLKLSKWRYLLFMNKVFFLSKLAERPWLWSASRFFRNIFSALIRSIKSIMHSQRNDPVCTNSPVSPVWDGRLR